MHKFMIGLTAALAVAVLPQLAAAQGGNRPAHPPRPKAQPAKPNPEALNLRVLFNRLDVDKDGKLNFDEFAVGVRHLRQVFTARLQAFKAPLQGGVQYARDKAFAYRAEFAKKFAASKGKGHHAHGKPPAYRGFHCPCPYCRHGFCPMNIKQYAKGFQGPPKGRQFAPGPMGPGFGRQFVPGPMGPGFGRQFVPAPKGPPQGKQLAKAPKGPPQGKQLAKAPKGPPQAKAEAVKGHKPPVAKKPEARKPEPKKPEARKPELKKPEAKPVEKKTDARSIEARLTALERQQAEIVALLRSVKAERQQREIARGDRQPQREAPHRGPSDRK